VKLVFVQVIEDGAPLIRPKNDWAAAPPQVNAANPSRTSAHEEFPRFIFRSL
jgi:hypothetical protein